MAYASSVGENWSLAHTCPPQVSLHVLEEWLEAMDITAAVEEEDSDDEVTVEEQEVMALHSEPLKKLRARQIVKL